MPTKWLYGGAWEKFPIAPGQVWRAGTGQVAVHNLFDPLPDWVRPDLLFIDPPWNLGNLNSFYTKAERLDYQRDFRDFTAALLARLDQIGPRICYIEMGRQNAEVYQRHLADRFAVVQRWDVVYYRKHPTVLLRGAATPTEFDYTGIDEAECIKILARDEAYETIGDICMGRGLLGLAAFAVNRPFVGTELNQRRLACLLNSIAERGGPVNPIQEKQHGG